MSDVAFAPPAPEGVAPQEELVSRDLSARAAEVAVALAAVVESACEPSDGVEAAAATLRSWAEYAVSSRAAWGSVALWDSPLQRVVRGVGLTDVELDIVLLVGLVDEHPAFADVMRLLHPRGEPRTSVMLADRLTATRLDDPASLRRLLTEGAAVTSGLLEVTGDGPAYDRSLVLADGVWATFQGHDAMPAWLSPVSVGTVPAGLERWLQRAPTRAAVQALRSRTCRVLSVVAPESRIALSRIAALAVAADRTVLAARLPLTDRDGLRQLALRALARDAVPVVVEATRPDDANGRGGGGAPVRPYGPILVCASGPPEELVEGVPVLDVPIGPIGHQDRLRSWLGSAQLAEHRAAAYASRYRLDPALTHDVCLDLRSRAELGPRDSAPDDREVAAAVRGRVSGRLPLGAGLTCPDVDWSRLVLEPEAVAQLMDAAARLRHQSVVLEEWGLGEAARAGAGVRLLFTGPPGTGKSLAAEVLATAAGTDLLRVDLSCVVSKWLGETEKNLAAMFQAAEHSQAVLFMDEADALFGTRTEVSDAHDRYANLETSYLLQRLDSFEGLAVLATNLRQNIDAAFLRRMDFVVDFTLPGPEARRRLWDLHLPAHVRASGLDVAALARRYAVPGGWIRNAALAAAFRAADDGGLVTPGHVVVALRREYDKSGKPFPGVLPAGHRADHQAAKAIGAAARAAERLTKEGP